MSTVDILKIQKLVQQKKFADVVFEIESATSEINRSALLHNLLGVCRASQKGKTDRDVQYALDDFEKAFYKDNLGQISLDFKVLQNEIYFIFFNNKNKDYFYLVPKKRVETKTVGGFFLWTIAISIILSLDGIFEPTSH